MEAEEGCVRMARVFVLHTKVPQGLLTIFVHDARVSDQVTVSMRHVDDPECSVSKLQFHGMLGHRIQNKLCFGCAHL